MKDFIIIIGLGLFLFACNANEKNAIVQSPIKGENPKNQKQIQALRDSIDQMLDDNGTWKLPINSQERQDSLDRALELDPTYAFLWQQKAMPLFKVGKYELGMPFLDKAVEHDRRQYQEYRAFMKCIFKKTYRDAIIDFEDCLKRNGNSYVMDHSYTFYIAISKLQLNEFEEAEELLKAETVRQEKENGPKWMHPLDLFYLGIARLEQYKFEEAITAFDRSLQLYPNFTEAFFYKGQCLLKLERKEEAREMFKEAKKNGLEGYTMNEDNALYELYPYQIRSKTWEY